VLLRVWEELMTRQSKTARARLPGVLAAVAALAASASAHALTIVPTFDSSITGASNALQIENRIDAALGFYSNFINPTTVNIYFQIGPAGLGANISTLYGPFNASSYEAALAANASANPQNTVLAGALNHINDGNGAVDPQVAALSANLRALGLNAPGALGADGVLGDGAFDGVITLSDTPNLIAYGNFVGLGQFGANQVIQHEVDEVLGFGGAGSLVGQDFGLGFPLLGIEDLYRYNGVGSGSFTTDPTENAYLSLDGGVTNLIGFNQNGVGDFGDFAKTFCNVGDPQHVQDWAQCPQPVAGQFSLGRGSIEVQALQAIGYNLIDGVPEPGTWALMIGGFGLVGIALRRRRPATA
jgi:hypothetical protein